MSNQKIRVIDLFAGIGGFRYGLEKANDNYQFVWASEWDKYASQIYTKHFGGCDTRDIRTVKSSEIPNFDLLVGGFPCQAFSIAGKRKGFDDTRGTLFFEIARILRDKRPRYFLLENVKGLLSHDEGKTFSTILGVLTELGYEFEWQVLNSKNFGVPQNRERVFIIGNLRGQPRPKVFPVAEVNRLHSSEITKAVSDAQRIYNTNGVAKTLKGLGGGLGAKTGLYAIPMKFLQRNQRNYQGEYSFTVDSVNTGGILKDMRVRRLTPTECERLQGFPDGWTDRISDTQRYKCLGNAVTTNVVTYIGGKLLILI